MNCRIHSTLFLLAILILFAIFQKAGHLDSIEGNKMTIDDRLSEPLALEAFELDEHIRRCSHAIKLGFLGMAQGLIKMNDEKLYILMDCKTFNSYLGTLAHELDRSWIYKLMRVYRIFANQLSIPDDRLLEIGPTKLEIISSVVNEENKDEWLDKAGPLSKSDLIAEVRIVQGKTPLPSLPAKAGPINPGPTDLPSNYLAYVREQPCCVCDKDGPSEAAHFPRTEKRGAWEHQVIPLCHSCHIGDLHGNGVDTFMVNNKQRIFEYFYDLIITLWPKGKE
jgi:hypothetical protein